MNISPKKLSALIVCSDDRSSDLAQLLVDDFIIFLRELSPSTQKWTNFKYCDHEWKSFTQSDSIPMQIDVLLFHDGQGDPAGIPNDISFRKKFVFSSPGINKADQKGHEDAIPIQQAFTSGNCPIKKNHLPALINFIQGNQISPPRYLVAMKKQH